MINAGRGIGHGCDLGVMDAEKAKCRQRHGARKHNHVIGVATKLTNTGGPLPRSTIPFAFYSGTARL
jgi:hypothetical protein